MGKGEARKPRVLFVGAFSGVQKGNFQGGQLYRCQSLVDSGISEYLDWILINSSLKELPPPSVFVRLKQAIVRAGKFYTALWRDRPDTVMVFLGGRLSIIEKGLMLIVAKMHGCRCICCPASGFIQRYFSERIMAFVLRLIFRYSDVIVCQGQWWKEFFFTRNTIDKSRFKVRSNWIDVRRYVAKEVKSCEENVVRILYLGWMVPYKGILDLIEAIRLMRQQTNIEIEVVACGDGGSLSEAKTLASEYKLGGIFKFPGFVDFERKRELLQCSDIFVLPSHLEGMPNALMEAMASGLACVATNVGGVVDLIPHRNIGLVVPPQDPRRLASALEEFVRDPVFRRNAGLAARMQIVAHNSIEKAWPEMYEILSGLPIVRGRKEVICAV